MRTFALVPVFLEHKGGQWNATSEVPWTKPYELSPPRWPRSWGALVCLETTQDEVGNAASALVEWARAELPPG
jgi:hypothetical protein